VLTAFLHLCAWCKAHLPPMSRTKGKCGALSGSLRG
jgi:hypothetical protein